MLNIILIVNYLGTKFNQRVLLESIDPNTRCWRRLRFIAIAGSHHLDEFL